MGMARRIGGWKRMEAVLAAVGACAAAALGQTRSAVTVANGTGALAAPANFFAANSNLLNQAVHNNHGGGGGTTNLPFGQEITNAMLWGASNGASGLPLIDSGALLSLNASYLASGSVSDARLPATLRNLDQYVATTINGGGITNLQYGNLYGPIPVPSSVSGLGYMAINWAGGGPPYETLNGGNWTNLPSANLIGALPAISGAALTGLTAGQSASQPTNANLTLWGAHPTNDYESTNAFFAASNNLIAATQPTNNTLTLIGSQTATAINLGSATNLGAQAGVITCGAGFNMTNTNSCVLTWNTNEMGAGIAVVITNCTQYGGAFVFTPTNNLSMTSGALCTNTFPTAYAHPPHFWVQAGNVNAAHKTASFWSVSTTSNVTFYVDPAFGTFTSGAQYAIQFGSGPWY
jgi:hypothetical protein